MKSSRVKRMQRVRRAEDGIEVLQESPNGEVSVSESG